MKTSNLKKGSGLAVRSVIIPRILHVVTPKLGAAERHMVTASDGGPLTTYLITPGIYKAVLGGRSGDRNQFSDLGLRGLANVVFRAQITSEELVVGLDILPKRMPTRGAAPVDSGKALTEGFLITRREDIEGFHVPTVHSGMDLATLTDLLDALRERVWKAQTSNVTLGGYRVERVEPNVFRAKVIAPKGVFSDAR